MDAASLGPIISQVSCFRRKKEKYYLKFMNILSHSFIASTKAGLSPVSDAADISPFFAGLR